MRSVSGFIGCLAVLTLTAACSATGGVQNDFAGSGVTSPGNGSSPDDAGITLGDPNNNQVALGGGGASSAGSAIVSDACAATSQRAKSVPLDIVTMFDQSISMDDPVSNETKWSAVTSALTGFLNSPSSNGVGMSIQYFPITDNSDYSDSCTIGDYQKPDVVMGTLPGNAHAITTSLQNHGPTGDTPTLPALQGAIKYARSWKASHPTHVVVVLLATDGDPDECDDSADYSPDPNAYVDDVKAAAAAGAGGVPQIPVFVIGVGDSLSALDGIAQSGGTQQAYLVDTGQNVTQQFIDALNKIRGSATLPCTYQLPSAPQGQTLNYQQINVQYTDNAGATPQILGQVSGSAQCGSSSGWYYDNPSAPTLIKLCPAACSQVSASNTGQVNVLLGCATQIAQPQ